MNRRQFLGAALAGAAGAAVRPTNFVIILADDLGYGDLACFGSRANQTPNLDRMAREGARLTDFYAPMPYCAPSRSSLLTGRYPFRTGMWSNPAPDAGIHLALSKSEVTLAEALKPRGYRSMCIGKWHLGHMPDSLPCARGFDEYYGIPYSNDMRPVQVVHNEKVVQYPVVQGLLTRDYTERAVDFIERNRQSPFLLYLAHSMPHKPLAASPEFYSRKPGQLYSDVIRELDWSVGKVLEKIASAGLDRDTLVIFTSDNGPWYGGNTGGLRGMKAVPWEGGIRVPMIARWPGRVHPGMVSNQPAGMIDIFPTVCAAAGAPAPADRPIDGKNILPMLSKPGVQTPHEALYSMSGPRLHVVRSGKWKLHVRAPGRSSAPPNAGRDWVDPRGPDGITIVAQTEQANPSQYPGVQTGDPPRPLMLFDMEADPAEQRDVAAQHPDVVARLKGMFDRIDAQVPQFPPVERLWESLRDIRGGDLKYVPR